MPILKNILAVIAGLMCGMFANSALVKLGPLVIPLPEEVDISTMERMAATAHFLKDENFVFPFLAHAVGTFVGALVAYVLSGSHRAIFAFVIGGLFLVAGIVASFMVPAPKWFIILDLLAAYLPMGGLAVLIGRLIKGPSVASTP